MGSLSISPDAGAASAVPIHSIAVDSKTPQRVYAAGPSGLFRSDDAGQTWMASSKGLNGTPLAVTLDPDQPQTVFTVLTDDTVWQSDDGATTWHAASANK